MFSTEADAAITTISTLIQLSVAPVFLLAGVAGLLNVFIGRLTRIIDRLEKMDIKAEKREKKEKNYKENAFLSSRRIFLIMRMGNINRAIFFCTSTGLMVSFVILTVFASELFSFKSELFISVFFILAMIFLIIALILFLREIYFTTQFIKLKRLEKH